MLRSILRLSDWMLRLSHGFGLNRSNCETHSVVPHAAEVQLCFLFENVFAVDLFFWVACCNLLFKTWPQCSKGFKDRVLDRLAHGSTECLSLMKVWLIIKGKQRLWLISGEWFSDMHRNHSILEWMVLGNVHFFICCIFICTLAEGRRENMLWKCLLSTGSVE